MFPRSIAVLLVLVLVGPSVVTATCELTCAMASHHRGAPLSSEAPCHEHEGSSEGAGVSADLSTRCHELADLPSVVIDAWLNALVVPAAPAPTMVISPVVTTSSFVRAHDRHTLFDPPPTHRPLRV
jgi:hypothetical protein